MHGLQVESDEVKTNILAAYVAGGQGSEVPGLISRLRINIKGSFELAYNRACALVATGKLEEAETALKLGIKQGEQPHGVGRWLLLVSCKCMTAHRVCYSCSSPVMQ
jgi:hypothetical protein